MGRVRLEDLIGSSAPVPVLVPAAAARGGCRRFSPRARRPCAPREDPAAKGTRAPHADEALDERRPEPAVSAPAASSAARSSTTFRARAARRGRALVFRRRAGGRRRVGGRLRVGGRRRRRRGAARRPGWRAPAPSYRSRARHCPLWTVLSRGRARRRRGLRRRRDRLRSTVPASSRAFGRAPARRAATARACRSPRAGCRFYKCQRRSGVGGAGGAGGAVHSPGGRDAGGRVPIGPRRRVS